MNLSSYAIGIDLGGSYVRAALIDRHGVVVHRVRCSLNMRTPAAVLEQLHGILHALVDADPSHSLSLQTIPMGMGVAAFLDSASGHVSVAPNLGWHDVPWGALLAERFGRPVHVINDLDAITVGETWFGAGQNAANVLCVCVGTGVGLGAVSAGRLVEGAHGMATELGHVKIVSHASGTARQCGCGARGCLEAYASGRHLPELVAAYAHAGMQTQLLRDAKGVLEHITAMQIEDAAQHQDAVALRVWRDVADRLGMAIANAVTLFDPDVIILGGGVLDAAPSLRAQVHQQIMLYLSPPYTRSLRIVSAERGDDAGLIGAAWLARKQTANKTLES